MPAPNPSNLNQNFIAFLAGDSRAGKSVYAEMRTIILTVVRKRAADLVNDCEDVLNEAFVLMLEAPDRFDPARSSASTFIMSVLVPDAIQRVRAKMARPGSTTRRRMTGEPAIEATFPMPDPMPAPETVPIVGYGSAPAIEAASDARIIYTRATRQLRLVIGGLFDGKSQTDIAAEMWLDRIKVVRMIKSLKEELSCAA
ncbi:RNA polymerase sigma factor [Bradyrhizobium liaoningense]